MISTIRGDILCRSLRHIPALGFTRETFETAAREARLSPMSISSIFPRGPVELVEFVLQTANKSTVCALQELISSAQNSESLNEFQGTKGVQSACRTRSSEWQKDLHSQYTSLKPEIIPSLSSADVVKHGLSHRISCITPYAAHWTTAIRLGLQSTSIARVLCLTRELADEISYYAETYEVANYGIRWYMKRGVLMGLYAAAEMHMVGDNTVHKRSTHEFVGKQVDMLWKA